MSKHIGVSISEEGEAPQDSEDLNKSEDERGPCREGIDLSEVFRTGKERIIISDEQTDIVVQKGEE